MDYKLLSLAMMIRKRGLFEKAKLGMIEMKFELKLIFSSLAHFTRQDMPHDYFAGDLIVRV